MKTITKSLLALAMLSLSGLTMADVDKDGYLNLQIGFADADPASDGLALIATYGYPMANVNPNFSIEGEFSASISDPDGTFAGTSYKASYIALAGYAVYTHPLSDTVGLRGRAGLSYTDVDLSPNLSGVNVDDGLDLSLGFGLTFGISKDVRAIGEYTMVSGDISHISIGIQYFF